MVKILACHCSIKICVSTRCLNNHKIGNSLIHLFPRDLLYFGPEIIYQQVDIGFTIVESVNVGSQNWKDKVQSFTECECGSAKNISLNDIFDVNLNQQLISYEVTKYECSVGDCPYYCFDTPSIDVHSQSHLIRPGKDDLIVCHICMKVFARRNFFKTHKSNQPGPQKEKQNCNCGSVTAYGCFSPHTILFA